MDYSEIAVDCDRLLSDERDRFRGPLGYGRNRATQNQRTDWMCTECFKWVQYLRMGLDPSKLTHYEPCGGQHREKTGELYGLELFGKCSLCIFWSSIRAEPNQHPNLAPREAFMKITPEEARGGKGEIRRESLNDILFLSDPAYGGRLQAGLGPDVSVTSVTNYADQTRIIPLRELSRLLVEEWLSECDRHHGNLCKPTPTQGGKDPLNIIVIDVERYCLVEINTAAEYMTLSYVRGGVPQLELTNDNKTELFREYGLQKHDGELPAVVKDAMSFVKSMGRKYVWVDSPGISQDDPVARQEQINRMSTIYSGSQLTLVALAAGDANGRLPGVEPGTRASDAHPIPWHPGVYFAKRTPDLFHAIAKSTYTGRGWTFQERTLSKRCLYFLHDQAYFQCQSAIWCEDRVVNCDEDLRRLNPLTALSSSGSSGFVKTPHGLFELYVLLLTEYMQKSLSDPSDVINAFAGLLESIQAMRSARIPGPVENQQTERSQCDFIHGLPEPILDAALLWCAFGNKPSRRILDAAAARKGALLQPSWSWTGWTTPINYDVTVIWGGKLRSKIPDFGIVIRRPQSQRLIGQESDLTDLRFAERQVEVLDGQVELDLWRHGTFLDPSERAVERILGQDLLDNVLAAKPLPREFGAGLIFEASTLPVSAFVFTSEMVMWRLTGKKAGPSDGQAAVRLYSYSYLETEHQNLCGAIYGIDGNSLADLGSCWLVALSEMQRTPKNGYVRYERGKCPDECCTHTTIRNIYGSFYEPREWCLLNVLVVARVEGHEDWFERKAIGHIHVDAWNGWTEPPSTTVVQLL